ncbi:MAG: prepilin-type N-terminal cleavage/methylation domain-containing protein [Pseudomonadota bacterium]
MRHSGFSLIEILIVLVVVTLISSLGVLALNIGGEDQESRDVLERLQIMVEYASDEAQFSGSDFGLLLTERVDERGQNRVTLVWRRRTPSGWQPGDQQDDVFEPLMFPVDAQLELTLDGEAVVPGDELATPDRESDGSSASTPGRQEDLINNPLLATQSRTSAQTDGAPQWLFLASGETQQGELIVWSRDGEPLYLRWDALARFSMISADPLPEDAVSI